MRRLRVLVLSWNYPTPAAPQRGLWVQRMCEAASDDVDVQVIVPTPWVPPLVPVQALSRFRRVPHAEGGGPLHVHFPRVPGSVEYWTHRFDAGLAARRVTALARTLHAQAPFDLVHAHFIYPDGVVAEQVGRALGVPVMTTEHAFWSPWLLDQPAVGRQVDAALPGIALVTAVSEFLRSAIERQTGGAVATGILPNVVDDRVFFPAPRPRDPNELLFAGLVRRVKRPDVLLEAFALARRTLPALTLRMLSARAYRAYEGDRRDVRERIEALGIRDAVTIVEGAGSADVAEAMRRCAFVVVSSTRRETFCSVAAEALACGTPLVITRCGGPEEFVSAEDGVMVEADSPAALADGIVRAFERRAEFDAGSMSARITRRFGRDAWRRLALETYGRVSSGRPSAAS